MNLIRKIFFTIALLSFFSLSCFASEQKTDSENFLKVGDRVRVVNKDKKGFIVNIFKSNIGILFKIKLDDSVNCELLIQARNLRLIFEKEAIDQIPRELQYPLPKASRESRTHIRGIPREYQY